MLAHDYNTQCQRRPRRFTRRRSVRVNARRSVHSSREASQTRPPRSTNCELKSVRETEYARSSVIVAHHNHDTKCRQQFFHVIATIPFEWSTTIFAMRRHEHHGPLMMVANIARE
jgi:hypothetical protein